MLSNELWNVHYQKKRFSPLSGKKRKYILNIIGTYCLFGLGTTTAASRFALAKQEKIHPEEVNGKEVKTVEHRFSELITGNAKKRTGKKKSNLWYPGLIKENILLDFGKIWNLKNKHVHQYFISFKGSFFGLGYDFSDDELNQFLDIVSQNNLFFAYIKKIKDVTSILFVKELFFKPTMILIKKGKFIPDEDLYLSFSFLADHYGFELHKMLKALHNDYDSLYMKKYKLKINSDILIKNIENLMNNTWYREIDKSTWNDNMIKLFYTNPESLEFYVKCYDENDSLLLFKTMKSLHQYYYETYGQTPPAIHEQKLVI